MSDLLEIAERILDAARGAEEVEVFVSTGVETEVAAYQGEVESLTSASSSDVGVRIMIDSPSGARVGTAWAGSLDDAAVAEAVRDENIANKARKALAAL